LKPLSDEYDPYGPDIGDDDLGIDDPETMPRLFQGSRLGSGLLGHRARFSYQFRVQPFGLNAA